MAPLARDALSRDSRGWVRLVVGGMVLLVVAGFVAAISHRQEMLLVNGTEQDAVVVKTIRPQVWGILDSGRAIVRYETDSRAYEEQIWLDDSFLETNDRVAILVDPTNPTRIRTAADPNTPNGLTSTVGLLAAVIGLTAAVSGARIVFTDVVDRRRLRRHPDRPVPIPPQLGLRGPPDAAVAWTDRGTRSAWRLHLQRSLVQIAVGAVVVGAMTFVFSAIGEREDDELAAGRTTTAVVTGGSTGGRRSPDRIDVRYQVDGTTYEGSIGYESPRDFPKDSEISILYDPANPRDIRTVDNSNRSEVLEVLLILPTAAGAAAILVGLAGLRAAVRWRRWLRRHRPRHVTVTPGHRKRRIGEDRWLLRIVAADDPPIDVVTRLTGPRFWLEDTPWLGGVPSGLDGPAILCAGRGRRVLILGPATDVPVELSMPRSLKVARKWLDGFA